MSDQPTLPLAELVEVPLSAHLTIQESFEEFDRRNPWVYQALVRLTRNYLATGRARIGIGLVVERLRWEYDTTTTGDPFRLNNNYRSRYVRKIVAAHPQWTNAFETRTLRAA